MGQLLDSDGESIRRHDDAYLSEGTRNFAIRHRLEAGTYFLKVTSHRNRTTGSYMLHTTVGVQPGPWFNWAVTVTSGDRIPSRFVNESVDHFYKFTLEEKKLVWVRTAMSTDIEMALYRNPRHLIDFSRRSAIQGNPWSGSIGAVLDPGTYYVRLTVEGSGPYILQVDYLDSPGNTPETALPTRMDVIKGGWLTSATDKDYFKVEFDDHEMIYYYTLGLDWLHLNVRLLDDQMEEVSSVSANRGRYTQWQQNRRRALVEPGTYYVEVSSTRSGDQWYLLHAQPSELFDDVYSNCREYDHDEPDPLVGCQWHLINDGQFGGAEQDINVTDAWAVTKGEGVNVAVVDDGLQFDHPDLTDNVVTSRNHSYVGGSVYNADRTHGTAVAGLIAARDNDIGVRGVAPRASIYGYNLLRADVTANEANAMTRNLADTAVSNNSWGPPDLGRPASPTSAWEAAVDRGVSEGNGGKGISYVWAAGNGGLNGNSNLDGYANYYGVTAVCAVNHDDTRASYSERGANLWVCAPSINAYQAVPGITTTTTRSWYRTNFGGTSASAPIVSGVIALVRAANPELTWRDVKLILAASARQNDPTHDSWEEGALQYSPVPTTERYSFSHHYGFGMVDAAAAVTLAESWAVLPAELRTITGTYGGEHLSIRDGTTVTATLTLDDFVDFVEFIEITVDIEHTSFRDLVIELESPSGAVSTLTQSGQAYDRFFGIFAIRHHMTSPFRFGSARHLGEDPAGEWTLRVTDELEQDKGTLKGWSLTAYGHGASAGAPVIESVARGDNSLTLTWTAPVVSGDSEVTGYDLRHRREDTTDRTSAGWTVIEGIWSSGDLTYELAGLSRGRYYDLQVRATSDDGTGPWSPLFRQATNPAPPGAPVMSQPRTRNAGLDLRWDPPAITGGAPITSYDLRSIRTDATERGDDQWALVENAGTLDGESYTHRITGLDNDVSYDVQVRAHNSAGASDWSVIVSATPAENLAPTFTDGQLTTRTVSEDTEPGTRFGDPFVATDPNAQALHYSVSDASGLFAIDTSSGELLVLRPLDYETAQSHTITVSVSDLQDEHGRDDPAVDDSLAVTVTVEDFNEGFDVIGPSLVKPLEGENEILATYSGVDPEGDTITWSLEGDDADLLLLNSRNQLRFLQPPDFETPLDDDEDNNYEVVVVASDGVNDNLGPVTVAVRDQYEPPVITGSAHITIDEVITDQGGSVGVDRYFTETVEGTRLRWRPISGADASKFSFDRGALSFREAPDYEARADANGDNVYEVTLSSTDFPDDHPSIPYAFFDVEVAVRNVNEPPSITGPAGPFTVRENGLLAVASFAASDPDEDDDVSLELGGLDRAAFTLTDGRLAFAAAPDFEAPADADADNSYELTLSTTDGEETATLDLVVRVTNEDEAGGLALSSPQPRIGVLLEATLDEPDEVSAESWTWERSRNRSSWSAISGAGGSGYTPAVADRDHYLRVTVRYTDAFGQKTLRLASTNPTRPDPGNNTAPFFATPPPDLAVAENTPPGRSLGSAIEGSDNEQDPLTYTLSVAPGGTPSFVIGRFNGQVRVAPDAVLDHEDIDSYLATVTIADSFNVRASASFTITVTDVDEPPVAEDDNAATFEDTAVLVDVLLNDRDPEGEPLVISVDGGQQLTGTVTVTAGNLISYLPDPDTHGIQRFSYRVSDGTQPRTDAATVTVRVEPVNDDPVFPAATAVREVDELAAPGDPVGDPVAATDVDGDSITYSLTGSDLFTVEPHNGQIMLAEGAFLDARQEPAHLVTVLADDRQGGSAAIDVTITVLEARVVPSGPRTPPAFLSGGFGGAGGGPTGPEPSEADFEWTVEHDIEALDSGHRAATGAWSDGEAAWVLDNPDGAGDAVYAYDLGSGERDPEREFALAETNRAPRGIWSDGETAWVSDSGRERLFAYDLDSGERDPERELELAPRNDDARGIWSDGETMWVLDDRRNALFAYGLQTGELIAEYELDPENDQPQGLWSDGVALWVSNHDPKRLFAYRLPSPADDRGGEDLALERAPGEDFTEPGGVGNNSPRGIWAAAGLMYVVDANDGKVYSYNMPDAWDARLASLMLPGVDIGAFDPDRTDYEGAPAGGVTETTVEAAAEQEGAAVAIEPADADGEAAGHQVALPGVGEITVTVTSEDGSRERVYRVALTESGPPANCLRGAVAVGFSLVVYGGGSVDALEACAQSRHVTALYALHEGEYVPYILDAPAFVRERFRALFADGVPSGTPLIVRSGGPATPDAAASEQAAPGAFGACLRGELAPGFSLVVHEGGQRRCARGLRRGARRLRALRPPARRVGPLHPRGARARERSLPRAVRRGRPPRHAARRTQRVAPAELEILSRPRACCGGTRHPRLRAPACPVR